jgi:hypothetical protein
MKSFKEYLAESKKVYSHKIKVAGELPEGFADQLKSRLDRCKIVTFENLGTTPIQKFPLDFPEARNMEVTVFEVVCEYPITPPEIANEVKTLGITENCFRIRGSSEPSEIDQITAGEFLTDKTLLGDSQYKEEVEVKQKEYFGNDFNKGFLKDLEKAAKERRKEGGGKEYKLPKAKEDKTGQKSAMGSK